MAEITRLLSSQNIKASVQNPALQVRQKNQPLQTEAISISSETGLLATPEVGSNGIIVIRSVLMPDFRAGRRVHVNSATLKGFLTIEKIRLPGSNFGPEWEAQVECQLDAKG